MNAESDFKNWCKSELFRVFAVPPGGYSRGNGAGVKNTSSSAAIVDPEVKAFYQTISGYTSMSQLRDAIKGVVKNNDIPDISKSTQVANNMSTYYAGDNDTTRENRFISSLDQRYDTWSDADAADIMPQPVAATVPAPTWSDSQASHSDQQTADTRTPEKKAADDAAWYAAADNKLISDLNPTGSIQKQKELDSFFNSMSPAATPTSTSGDTRGESSTWSTSTPTTTSTPTKTTTPTAVNAPSQEQQQSDFYAAEANAKADAKAGNPDTLRNFDRYFGYTRPEAEYSQEFYYGSSPDARISAVNALNITLEQKTQVIAEIKIGNSDTVSNMVGWLDRGNPPQPAALDLMSSTQGRIDIVNALNIPMDQKLKVIAEIKIGNSDTVSNMVGWLDRGNQPQPAALDLMSSQDGKIALVNSLDVSQDIKKNITAEIMIGNNDSISNMVTWFERGNPPQPAALAYLNPPPVAVVAPTATGAAPVDDASSVADAENSSTSKDESDSGTDDATTIVDKPLSANLGQSGQETPGEKGQETADEAHANAEIKKAEGLAKAAAAQAQADDQKEAALATATAAKSSAKESRMKKLMNMRKPWGSGGGSSNGSDSAMAVPPITPSSQIPPPPL